MATRVTDRKINGGGQYAESCATRGAIGDILWSQWCGPGAQTVLDAEGVVPQRAVALDAGRSPGTDSTRRREGQGGPSGAGANREVSGLLASVAQWHPGPHDPA